MQTLADEAEGTRVPARGVAVAALVVVLSCVLTRGVVSSDPFPWWSDDPTVIAVPVTGLLPLGSILLSVVTVVASAVACMAAYQVGRRGEGAADERSLAPLVECGLLLAGMVGAASHGLWVGGGSLDDLSTGMSWSAAMSAGVAASACRRDAGLRRLVLAALLGGLVMVSAKAGLQVFVEHRATVASFEANREAVLASHGWTAGSPMARAFEHRLRQADATGWFGLSNVVATFGAGAAVMGVGLLAGRRREEEGEGPDAVGLVGAVVAVAGAAALLVLGGSKGGYAGAGVGVAAAGAAWLARRRGWAWAVRWLPMAVVAAVLAAVGARWAVGERLGERSLLFRGYYLEASWRILGSWLPWGTGPEGFRDAYMAAKNPLNPEEISSPHNVLADFACTLGLAGVAWCGLWLLWVARLGPGLLGAAAKADEEPAAPGREIKPVFLVVCAATIAGVWVEAPAGTPETAAMRVAGLALALLAALGVLGRADGAVARSWVAAGGVTLAALGLIDLTPTAPGAAGWYAMLLGVSGGVLGLGGAGGAGVGARGVVHWRPVAVAAAVFGAFAGLVKLGAVAGWQSDLREAFEVAAGASRVRNDLEDVSRGRLKAGTAEWEEAGARLAAAGIGPGMSPEAVGRRVDELALRAAQEALPLLIEASVKQPAHLGTREAACRLQMQVAAALKAKGDVKGALEAASSALALSVPVGTGRAPGAAALTWQASAIESASRLREDPPHLWVPLCARVLEAAAERDPYGMQHPMRLVKLYEEFGPAAEASRWAKRVVELDGWNRMDPSGTRRLSAEEAARYKALAGGG